MEHASEDLTVEGDDPLADLLRIADVERGRLLELKLRFVAFFLDLPLNLFSADGNLPSDGIFSLNHILAQTVEHGLVGAHVLADERLLAKLAPVALDLLNGPAEHSHLQG